MNTTIDPAAIANSDAERRAIVKLYDKGCTVEYDSAEMIEMNSRTDHNGFIHDKPVQDFDPKETRKRDERSIKWMKMFKDDHSFSKYSNSKKLHKRMYKGVPHGLRGVVWSRLLDVDTARSQQRGIYQKMKHNARLRSADIRQIDLDVNRTLRDNELFHQRYSRKQQQLFHVLAAYSIYNMEVGYCQGMSQLAGLLLMYLDEESAFWAMSALMSHSKYAMHGFFIPSFPKLHRFETEHNKYIERLLPKLKKHFDKYNIPSSLYTIKWFMQCFLDRVPFSLALRLWDIYIQEGEKLLLVMSYNILRMHKDTLLRSSMEETINLLQTKLSIDFGYDDDIVIKELKDSWSELRKLGLDKLHTPKSETVQVTERPSKPFGLEVTEQQHRNRVKQRVDHLSSGQLDNGVINGATPTTPTPATPKPATPTHATPTHATDKDIKPFHNTHQKGKDGVDSDRAIADQERLSSSKSPVSSNAKGKTVSQARIEHSLKHNIAQETTTSPADIGSSYSSPGPKATTFTPTSHSD